MCRTTRRCRSDVSGWEAGQVVERSMRQVDHNHIVAFALACRLNLSRTRYEDIWDGPCAASAPRSVTAREVAFVVAVRHSPGRLRMLKIVIEVALCGSRPAGSIQP